jgi:hypothetical protein
MKKTQHYEHNNRGGKQNRNAPKERALLRMKMSQPPAGKIAAREGAKAASLSTALGASIPNQASLTLFKGVDDATSTAFTEAVHSPAASTGLDPGRAAGRATADKPVLSNTAAPAHADGSVNGELPPIDVLQSLAPEEREIVQQSDAAFVRVRQTWESWKQVRAGLVVLRALAMRETGTNDRKSKLYKNRFHELLEQREYCSAKMDPSTRKALLTCAELVPEIDEWQDCLDERRRLRLNHPINVLNAFRKAQEAPTPPERSARTKHELEIEKVRQEAAVAVSIRDERINELQQQIDTLPKQVDVPDAATESDTNAVVQYVIAACRGSEIKVRQVIDALNAYLEDRPS